MIYFERKFLYLRNIKNIKIMALLTYNQIKREVGEAWVLVANPEYSEKTGQLKRAELIYFDADKKKVYLEADKCKAKHIGFFYFGNLAKEQVYIL